MAQERKPIVSFGSSDKHFGYSSQDTLACVDIELDEVKSIAAASWHTCASETDMAAEYDTAENSDEYIAIPVKEDSISTNIRDDEVDSCGKSRTASTRSKDRTINSFLLTKSLDKSFTPVTVAFENISYRISLHNSLRTKLHGGISCIKNIIGRESYVCDTPAEKIVLHPFSGTVEPGELVAILGPSGCGKTSFLNLLAGRLRTGTVSGQVLYNGITYNKKMKGNVLGYVMQEDALLQNLTVRETFQFALELRYGHLPKKTCNNRVQDVIDELGLRKCADSMVGGSFRRGISGGEKKRVSIGVELLANPSLLFLDEPTSGLDSTTAKNLVETLVFLASQNRTVVCTIHQPQSSIFGLFDKILLLSQGIPMFFGPAEEAVAYFSALNFVCPSYTNPSDFFLDLVSVDARNENDTQSSRRLETISSQYRNSLYCKKNEANAKIWKSDEPQFDFTQYLVIDPSSFFRQFWVLLRRNFRDSLRNKIATLFRILQSIFMAGFCGFLYFNISNTQQSIIDRRGALFFVAIQQAMSGFLSIIGVFHMEKLVYYREHDGKMYGTLPYFFAKFFAELPISLISPMLFVSICYPLVGLQTTPSIFFIVYACLLLSTLTAQSLGLVVGSISPSLDIANIIAPAMLGFMVVFGGLLISNDSVPVYMKWIPLVNFVKYSFEILSWEEFTGLNFTCTPEEAHLTLNKCPIPTGEDALRQINMDSVNLDYNFGLLCTLFVGFSILAYFLLRFEITRR